MNLQNGTSVSGLAAVYLAAHGVRDVDGEWRLPPHLAAPAALPAPLPRISSPPPPPSALAPAAAPTAAAPIRVSPPHAMPPPSFAASSPAGWLAEWDESSDLRAEFESAGHYVAFKQGIADGSIRVLGQVAAAPSPPLPGVSRPGMGTQPAAPNHEDHPAARVYKPNLVEPVKRGAYGRRVTPAMQSSLADRAAEDVAAVSLSRSRGTPEAERRLAWQSRWLGSEDIRAEFSACDDYVAYMESLGVRSRSLLR